MTSMNAIPNPRAVQELDLLLQEGRADDPHLLEGLVRVYAHELFRFAWVIHTEIESSTVQRLLARRAVVGVIGVALRQLRRFQEQPSTFLWLLRLTYQQVKHQTPDEKILPAQHLHTSLNLPPEDIAYILNIPNRAWLPSWKPNRFLSPRGPSRLPSHSPRLKSPR